MENQSTFEAGSIEKATYRVWSEDQPDNPVTITGGSPEAAAKAFCSQTGMPAVVVVDGDGRQTKFEVRRSTFEFWTVQDVHGGVCLGELDGSD